MTINSIGYHKNPFYRIANTLLLKQICPNEMEIDEALYHISVFIDIAEQQMKELRKLQ